MQHCLTRIILLLLIIAGFGRNVFAQNFPVPAGEYAIVKKYRDFILKKEDSISRKISDNIFVLVQPNKTSSFIGEPIVVRYKLYTRLKSVSNVVKYPSFNGFSVIDLPNQDTDKYVVEKLDGRNYNVYTLRTAQLYPLQPGAITLEPISVENDIYFVKEQYLEKSKLEADSFGDFIPGSMPAEALQEEKITLQSKPMQITVKALPQKKKPVSFSGAVGNFTIKAETEKNELTTADEGKLKITISGEGNLALLTAPEFTWPAGVEVFEPRMKDEWNRLSVPVSGSKSFEYSFNIDKAGSYTMPAIDYSFFNVASGEYNVIKTKPIVISVAKTSGKKNVLPVAEAVTARESFSEMLFTKRWLIILPVALLIFTGLFFWLRADNKKQQQVVGTNETEPDDSKTALITAIPFQNPLQQTEEMLQRNNAVEFYTTLNKELHIFLAIQLQLSPEMMDKRDIHEGLDRAGVPVELGIVIQDLLNEVSLYLYTPVAAENNMRQCYEKALGILHSFDRKLV